MTTRELPAIVDDAVLAPAEGCGGACECGWASSSPPVVDCWPAWPSGDSGVRSQLIPRLRGPRSVKPVPASASSSTGLLPLPDQLHPDAATHLLIGRLFADSALRPLATN